MTATPQTPALPLSVIVITKNEAHAIDACLASVAWADDIVVVDAESDDDTAERARRGGARVFVEPWQGYAAAKRLAVARTRHDWVLWLDADERVPPETAADIAGVVSRADRDHAAWRVARRAFFLGKWIRHAGWYPGHVVRLFLKEHAEFSDARVHEQLRVRGSIGTLPHDLEHYTDDTLEHYFEKFNRYTTLAADDAAEAGRTAGAADLLLRPPAMFLKMYVLRRGCLDGVHGLVLCIASASYVFAKYAKLWERTRRGGASGARRRGAA